MNDTKFKHLEFIHNTINRMSSNSFIIKGWIITLITAIFVLADNESNKNFLLISLVTIPTFWYINSFFLQQERKYRKLYDEVRVLENSEIDFSMNTNHIKSGKYSLISSMFSRSIWPLYLFIFIINIVMVCLIL